jgi:hypothetical protein
MSAEEINSSAASRARIRSVSMAVLKVALRRRVSKGPGKGLGGRRRGAAFIALTVKEISGSTPQLIAERKSGMTCVSKSFVLYLN